jgi:neutral ceramidase
MQRHIYFLSILAACQSPSDKTIGRAPLTISPGAPVAGVAEAPIDFPAGSPMGGYSNRCDYLGGSGDVDRRQSAYALSFTSSAGFQTRPMAKGLWLENGDQHFVLLKADVIYSFDALVRDLEDRLSAATGADLRGRVVVTTSHTHNAPGNFSDQIPFYLGGDRYNEEIYQRLAGTLESVALEAYDTRMPAAIGMGIAKDWDPDDRVYSDRRDVNDDLIIWPDQDPSYHKDPHLWVLRVDEAETGAPMGLFFTFGIHGTSLGSDNAMISVDSTGHIEHVLQERFDSPVVVSHLQGSGGDASPRGTAAHGHAYARMEGIGEFGVDAIMALWSETPTAADPITMESVSHAYPQGLEEISVTRDGSVDWHYTPYNDSPDFAPDNIIYDESGDIISPIDEFNAIYGGVFCGYDDPLIQAGTIGTSVYPYDACVNVELLTFILNGVFLMEDFNGTADTPLPLPSSTRALTNATRLGPLQIREPDGSIATDDFLMTFFPGETTALFSEQARRRSATELGLTHSMVVGYAQDHEGYLLLPEDWLLGGYEANISLWGPLQAEYLLEGVLASAQEHLLTDRLEDQDPLDRFQSTTYTDRPLPTEAPDITPAAGTQPEGMPEYVFTPLDGLAVALQPDAVVPRAQGMAQLLWEGGDPGVDTPEVIIERQVGGEWQPVLTPSGRVLSDLTADILLTHTPDPLYPYTDAQQHLWWAAWQPVGFGADRMGLEEGTYRLHVYGETYSGSGEQWPWPSEPYEVVSDPFTVVPATLQIEADDTGVSAWLQGHESGFRLLDIDGASNGANPLQGASLTWVFTDGSERTESFEGILSGSVTRFEGAAPPADAESVIITDVYGNQGQSKL